MMIPTHRLLFALAAGLAFSTAHAQERIEVGADASRAALVSERQVQHVQRMTAGKAAARGASTSAAASTTVPGQPQVNPVRAYPPSCLADPLPDTPSGPSFTRNVPLAALNVASGDYVLEDVTVTLWRVACSSADPRPAYKNSATLMRIQRQARYEGDTGTYPLFPSIQVAQGNINLDDPSGRSLIRVTTEPNTFIADTSVDAPMIYSTTFVLENYPFQSSGYFDFNAAFKIEFDNLLNVTQRRTRIDVGDYVPNQGSYPDAFRSLPISGYMSTNWSNSGQSGEGIIVNVDERVDSDGFSTNKLSFTFAWFTYDADGIPFWLFGGADFDRGSRIVTANTVYLDNGTFAGVGQPAASNYPWGKVTFDFPNCDTMTVKFAGNSNLPMSLPRGSGTRAFKRIANTNGMTCE